MPTNWLTQNLRASTGMLDTVNDSQPGGGSSSPGFASGQLGAKVTLGQGEVKLSSAFTGKIAAGAVSYGTYQYVQTLSTDSLHAAVGLLAFWSNRNSYIVSTVDTVPSEIAGIFLGSITPGNYGFIQVLKGGEALALYGGAITVAANELVFPLADGTARLDRVAVTTDLKATYFGQAVGAKNATNYGQIKLGVPPQQQ